MYLFFLFFIFFVYAYGIVYGYKKITINKVNLRVNNFPYSLKGLKILHISDLHLGTYLGRTKFISKVKDTCNSLDADIIVISGDIINNFYEEILNYKVILSELKAKYGKYAVLGNHDFGEYVKWKSQNEKKANIEKLVKNLKECGFTVLRNEYITFGKSDTIYIAGVDNIGKKPFKKYGDVSKIIKEINLEKFIIFISHDPTHWDTELKNLLKNSLTLSGHTHGFQFSIGNWSPVKYRYNQWHGLYRHNNNFIYVNNGIGMIGYVGRIGSFPEITLISINPTND
ncbi:MAG: metallophosphoesterase [Bacteroidales bacterium]|nr:metallophosphoesterase [Bacteroidales bacterium]